MSDNSDDQLTIKELINRRVRECLTEMKEKPPRDRNALAATVESLLKARPLAADDGFSLLEALKQHLSKETPGPRAIGKDNHE